MRFIKDKKLNVNNCSDDKLINRVINWLIATYLCGKPT